MNIFARFKFAARILFAQYKASKPNNNRSRRNRGPQDARFSVNQSSRTAIAEQAKEFENDSAIGQRLGSIFCDYTVGANGLVLIPNSTDQEWNAAAKKYWNKTCQFIDLRSRQNFGCLQGLMAWRWFFDGEIFIIKTYERAGDGRIYPRIQLAEYYQCQTPPEMLADEGKTVVDGVAIDARGRPTGYYFRESSASNKYRLVSAKDVIHIFEPSRPGQYRGISFWHAAINYLHLLDDLQTLEFRALEDAAEKSTFIETPTGEMPPSFTGGLPGDGFGMPTAATETEVTGEQIREAVGGRTMAIPMGAKPWQFTPVRPTESTRALWSYLTSCICGAIGIPKMVAFSEWLDGAQGTVVRGDYDIASQFFRARSGIIAAACREVYIWTIDWGIRTEPDLADKPGDGSWTEVTVRPPRAINVDVGRNSSAMLAELAAGATNFDLIYSPLGLDAREELSKSIRFMAWLKKECAAVGKQEGVEINPGEIVEHAAAALEKRQDAIDREAQSRQLEDQEK